MLRLVATAALLAACGGGGGAPPSSSSPASVDPSGGDVLGGWRLTSGSVDGEALPILDDHPVTAILQASEIGGTAACNGYGGRLSATGSGVRVEELASTDMACMPDEVMALESAYFAALSRVTQIGVVGEELVMTGDGVELRFTRLEEPDAAALVGTTWRLETLVVGDVAAAAMGDPADLELRADGTLRGSTGCRSFEGRWIETPERIEIPELAMNEESCPDELAEQDSHVVSVIGDGFFPTVEGDLLTLLDPGSIGLVYRAGE